MKYSAQVTILGAGAWGTALAQLLASTGKQVTLWFYESAIYQKTKAQQTNPYLPGVKLNSKRIQFTDNLQEASSTADFIVLANPAQHQRAILKQLTQSIKPQAILINASKGIEITSAQIMSEVIKETLPDYYQTACYLSGGSFADELCSGEVTAVDVASLDDDSLKKVKKLFISNYFDIHLCHDIIGVQIGGAFKNIIAIAAGMLAGLNKDSYNTKSALITRGLKEIKTFGKLWGAKAKTFDGYSGLGDLYATTNNPNSRNYKFGEAIAKGRDINSLISSSSAIIEGYYTTKAVYEQIYPQVDNIPITEELYLIMYKNKPINKAWRDLLKKSFDTKKRFL